MLDVSVVFAQAPDTMWTWAYQEAGEQAAADICQVKGGFVVVGHKMISQNNYDVLILKISDSGNLIWTRTYGGQGYDMAYSVWPTLDSNLIVAGTSDRQTYLLKINQYGDTLWTGKYHIKNVDFCYAVKQAPDGGFVVAAMAYDSEEYANMGILKVGPSGRREWARDFGGPGEDKAFDVYPTREGNYALVGFSEIQPVNHLPAWLIMIGPNGNLLWSRYYGHGVCDFMGIDQTPDGGFILAGRSKTDGQDWWDIYLVRIDAQGGTLWTRTLAAPQWDGAVHVERTYEGNFFVGAYTFSFGGDVDFYFLKLDSLGNLLWQGVWGSDQYEWSLGAAQCWDGGYVMAGIQYLSDEHGNDPYVVRLFPDETPNAIYEEGLSNPAALVLSPNYPNPFNNRTVISYSLPESGPVSFVVYNLAGQTATTLREGTQGAGAHSIVWEVRELSSGIYFGRLSAGGNTAVIRMMYVR